MFGASGDAMDVKDEANIQESRTTATGASGFMAWTPNDVAAFLRTSNCSEFADAIVEHMVSGSLLPSMTLTDIRYLGIDRLGPQLKLQALLADLVAGNIPVDSHLPHDKSKEPVTTVSDSMPFPMLLSNTVDAQKTASVQDQPV